METAVDAAAHEQAAAFVTDQVQRADAQGLPVNEFITSLWTRVRRGRQLSDAQVQGALKFKERWDEREAERAAERANAEPVITGFGLVITGEVLSVKLHENKYGVKLVMTVKDDRGFRVWGTVPQSIANIERGQRVTFQANVERPVDGDDETFGFFKRPRHARVIA
jgi:hypothetical protein